jgi:hypothetical protein
MNYSAKNFRQQIAASVLPFPLRTVPISTRTQPTVPLRLGWGEFVPKGISRGVSVMGNAFFVSGAAGQRLDSASVHDDEDDGWDTELNTETESLLEENARLRALVVQLSRLVLKNVVERK